MDDVCKRFVMLLQTQSIVADIKWGQFKAADCVADAMEVSDETLHIALQFTDKSLPELVEEFLLWQYERAKKPAWLKMVLESKGEGNA